MDNGADIQRLIGPPVTIDDEILQKSRDRGRYGPLLFDLYKEASALLTLTSAASIGQPIDLGKLERNQAICAGLLVRIAKLMTSVIKLSSGNEHGETVQVLNRCIVESVINLRFLLLRDSDTIYEKFIKNGLRAERELYDIIRENVDARNGEKLAIEEGMLRSIIEKCESSGLRIDEINPKAGSWGGSLQDRIKTLGYGDKGYTILQRIQSHAIHGTWMDLLNNHLIRNEDGFEPNFEHLQTDGELLMPVAIMATESARDYLDRYFGPDVAGPIYDRINSVQVRLVTVETSREDWQVKG